MQSPVYPRETRLISRFHKWGWGGKYGGMEVKYGVKWHLRGQRQQGDQQEGRNADWLCWCLHTKPQCWLLIEPDFPLLPLEENLKNLAVDIYNVLYHSLHKPSQYFSASAVRWLGLRKHEQPGDINSTSLICLLIPGESFGPDRQMQIKGAEPEVGANGTGSEDRLIHWLLAPHLLSQAWEVTRTASAFIFICTSGN